MLVHVAVGVIFNRSKNEILIAKRADNQHQGGLWEFPGGKVEQGETVQQALKRELEEELGMQCNTQDMQPLISIPFHYSDKSVLLDVWSVYDGVMAAGSDSKKTDNEEAVSHKQLVGKEGQPLIWTGLSALADYEFPAANKAILDALLLPEKIAITKDNSDPSIILAQVANTLKHHKGVWIQLRAPSLDQMQFTQLAMQFYGICHEAGSKLIWNCPLSWYQVAFADGLHLSNKNLNAAANLNRERLIPSSQWLSTSCHNSNEISHVQNLVDYVLISPINETKTHPQASVLGWNGFKQLTDESRLPCYALGGLAAEDTAKARQFGAQGIAGISGFIK